MNLCLRCAGILRHLDRFLIDLVNFSRKLFDGACLLGSALGETLCAVGNLGRTACHEFRGIHNGSDNAAKLLDHIFHVALQAAELSDILLLQFNVELTL